MMRLGAFAHPKNAASIRVLEKLGFQIERRDTVMGMDSIVFSLAAPPSFHGLTAPSTSPRSPIKSDEFPLSAESWVNSRLEP